MIRLARRFFLPLLVMMLAVGGLTGCGPAVRPELGIHGGAEGGLPKELARHGIRYTLLVETTPRPLRIHHLEIPLVGHGLEVVAAPAADPPGPATAALEDPVSLARRYHALVLVNANPWQGLPDAAGRRTTNWRPGLPVETLGLVATGGRILVPPTPGPAGETGHCSFWIDTRGPARIGTPSDLDLKFLREGIAGFGRLLKDGHAVDSPPSPSGPIHPRTALGFNAAGDTLHLVVVDGRQPGYSEGMTLAEVAALMARLGCTDAVNLDGGGSSIMLAADPAVPGAYRTLNDPSTKILGKSVARPIPVALVIRSASRN